MKPQDILGVDQVLFGFLIAAVLLAVVATPIVLVWERRRRVRPMVDKHGR